MRIEEITVDGFKSYASRTTIAGWDPEFNAITGLNGSGKSNVLDSICFVLGIKNLSQVRAGNLQDLIYKRGQAGVTKASVTIVFNNEDRSKSPLGYEGCPRISVTRQISVGGKSKYLINSQNQQEQTVANLFQSVQLNVNNPHFLIMQGKITQVLNMKAPEILSMIEEAAGTRMFEDRKEKAYRTMAKKEKKVEEITANLNEDITPKLDRLRGEKRAFLEYQKLEIEVDRLTRLVVAYEYCQHQEHLNQTGQDHEAQVERRRLLNERLDTLKSEITNLQEDISRIQANKRTKMSGGGRFATLQASVDHLSTELARVQTQCDLKAVTRAEEGAQLQSLAANLSETEASLIDKRQQICKVTERFEAVKSENDERARVVRQTEELIQTLTTGVSAEEGHESGYMEQLQVAKQKVAQAGTAEEQAKRKLTHTQKQIKEVEPKCRKAEAANRSLMANLESERSALAATRQQLEQLAWDPQVETTLRQRQAEEQHTLTDLREQHDRASSQMAGLNFQYANPTPNFDRSQVKGLVANLVTLEQANYDKSTALEICAGGRLYNVVVSSEVVGTQLLQRGQLRRRVTIIPLNKIQAFRASAKAIATAKELAPDCVNLALEIVGYDEDVAPAMQYVFGSTLVCRDAATAEKVTFHKDVRLKSVTLDGDVYDPAGTLQGGSKPNSSGLLIKLQTLHDLKRQIKAHETTLADINRQLQEAQSTIRQYKEFTTKADLKAHEVNLLEESIAKTTHAQLLQQLQSLRQELEDLQTTIVTSQNDRGDAQQQCQYIEKEMKEFKQDKTSKLKEMKAKLVSDKAELNKNTQGVKSMQRDVQTLTLEIVQIEVATVSNNQVTTDEKALKETMAQLKTSLETAQEEFDQENEALRSFDEETRELNQLVKTKTSQQTEIRLEVQNLTHDLERFDRDRAQAAKLIHRLEEEHDWIVDSRTQFGQAGTPFDFLNQDPREAKKQLGRLNEQYNKLRRTTNTSVMASIENVEKREAGLKQMLATVLKDKRKIEETIESLVDYKREHLERTWQAVNKDFGAIFGELLAGCSARLEPPEGKTLIDGLEIKVCLGGVWKQSLTELSGGQRSLVALSLILSLLQFKPAPMYILDEIDSALDLSHTQNIGQLFRTRFKGAQFIVVSLKEGMFNNANVLFRAKFRDGISTVERIAQRARKTAPPSTARSRASSTAMGAQTNDETPTQRIRRVR
ncbi:RecF/RecN/SMC N terminal domain-containing protein [Dimargaris cristalligena]|uniref:Structural maintenance of chromosomes protein n=1 Tax=Dimargaris cristalligena TaxID=215637 RepID=A0A4P9ZRX6_9FUNG|nr:RecF/RecN/SMC N terminal domain-containing protein [Dimargaris cristalligena]|eukprot:RKP36135.1 RecF/RecN/SMC N terminal domain-containing protein [Dimargaris cristalligena]